MKLHNYTLLYLSGILLVVMGLWASVFYINMIDEIHDSIDDGLDNSRQLIIRKALVDSQLLNRQFFHEGNYQIHEIPAKDAHQYRDTYIDSTLFMENEMDNEPVRILKTVFRGHNGKYYQLEIISSMVEEDDLIEDLFYALLWLYVIIIASVLWINSFLLKKIWKPFYSLLDQLRKFRLGGNDSLDPPPTKVSEFNHLNESIAKLVAHTKETFTGQKQLIENAAHELQTPLAISINRLELLADQGSATESQLHEIAGTINTLQRMARLNKSLLLLAKIDSGQFVDEEGVSVNKVVEHVLSMFSEMLAHKGIQVSVSARADLHVTMNASLADVLITNLVKNAIVHNIAGGTIRIIIEGMRFSIRNTGPAAALDRDRVFDRFYKNATEKNTTGLGLAIVRSIIRHYHFSIVYQYDNEHLFELDLLP